MTSIAHLTDLHFGRVDDAVVDALREEMWRLRPHLILISGDFTQRARTREFEAAREFVESLPSRPLMVPGNHDYPLYNLWQRMFKPLRRFHTLLEAEKFPQLRHEGVVALGLNSARRVGTMLDWTQGRISARQLDVIRDKFADRGADELCVLVTHHPFIHPPSGASLPLIRQPADTLGRLADAGVDLILAGHFHLNHSDLIATRHPEAPEIVVAQGGSATSTRLRGEPNAYHRIDCEFSAQSGWRVKIQNRAWEAGRFRDDRCVEYRRAGRNWSRVER